MLRKSELILARDDEWRTLAQFVAQPAAQLRIAVLSGRRRVGKSYLLRELSRAADGLYVTAVAEEDGVAARQRFAADIGRYAGVGADLIATGSSWEALLSTALDVVIQRSGPSGLLIIDELPYWMAHSPELPGLLQLLYDRSQTADGHFGGRIVLCGSAMSVMTTLLSGTKALRGRASCDLRMRPFDLVTTGLHWGIEDPATALRLHAVLGGSPGYRALSSVPAPQTTAEFGDWVTGTVLDPGQALFSRSEAEYLLREDPKFTGSVLHYGILNAVARGAGTPSKIGGLLERERTTLARPIASLVDAGYLTQLSDPLWERRPRIRLADPIIRFHNLVTVPNIDLIEAGRAREAWARAQPTVHSMILGPHFEECARDWFRLRADANLRGITTTVSASVVNDQGGRAKHEIDVLGLDRTSNRVAVTLIGEAKATLARRTPADLDRLDHIRTVLTSDGLDTTAATLALFATEGFHADLVALARRRGDVLLVDLPTMYGQADPVVKPAPS